MPFDAITYLSFNSKIPLSLPVLDDILLIAERVMSDVVVESVCVFLVSLIILLMSSHSKCIVVTVSIKE